MNPEDPKRANPAPEESEAAGPNPETDAFFQRLPASLRWPAPSEAAVAAAMEVIQRMAGAGPEHDASYDDPTGQPSGVVCGGCGHPLGNGMRFCGNCGLPFAEGASVSQEETGSSVPSAGEAVGAHGAQHHYHHHYHHFVGNAGGAPASTQHEAGAAHGRASSVSGAGSRAGLAARQIAQDWAQACNTKHLDDLVELYTSDATLIRSNVPPIRSTPAIREFLFASLEAGLGDVEMESLRTEVYGEIALDLGRCKMLVPVAMGKRREERGKYLLVMARQPAGHWKIIADCWSTDLSVSTNVPAETTRKTNDSAIKKPR